MATPTNIRKWQLVINRITKQASVSIETDCMWKPWRFMGTTASEQHARALIADGWPDSDGVPIFNGGDDEIEVIR